MSSLIGTYNGILQKTAALREQLARLDADIGKLSADRESHVQARIARLQEQLSKIDEYQLKIEAFRKLAERNLESRNLLTIEAPPGYRVNLNRLRQWAMMIDPLSSNDPYAQRVYLVANCDKLFLEKKRKEFTDRIRELQAQDGETERSAELRRLEAERESCLRELRSFAAGEDMLAFARSVEAANHVYWYETAPETYGDPQADAEWVSPGAYALPLDLPSDQQESLKAIFGKFYDAQSGKVLLPVEIGRDSEFIMEVVCAPSRTKQLDQALQNLILSFVERNRAGSCKVYVLDGLRYNTASLGSLRQLEDTFALAQVPRNPEQLSAALEEIVSSFADMDEIMELSDSVIEYDRTLGDKEPLPRRLVILFGRPSSLEGADRDMLNRIMTNYERYGISLVCVSYRSDWKKEDRESELTEYAAQNAIRIQMMPRDTFIRVGEEPRYRFTWYTLAQGVGPEYAESLKQHKIEKNTLGNEYIRRYSLTDLPPYTRAYKPVVLPFGIDGKDRVGEVSFENENFATYLVGASRSGKSTLLHTLIAGLIRNYHPDNMELWLADFKQLEFKRYIRHLPPHVKYVLLDESTELVFDLVDKLTAEMMERQKLFSRLGVQRIDQVDPTRLEKPLPVIFVILDEFSIMSQSLADSPIYRLRLQNILAKGAALGIKFLFSSQTFTTGVAGLSATARAQIQQRIAMKGSREEISATLELSANLKTDQVRNWMEALPPHYALVKFRQGADTLPEVKRYLVMYFKDYAPRDEMIERIRRIMQPVETYEPGRTDAYVDKRPVLVDGNTFEAFEAETFLRTVRERRGREDTDLTGEEMLMAFGAPRLMERVKLLALTAETRENLLLIARSAEQACAASILCSALRAYRLQGGEVQIWAYGRDPIFRAYGRLLGWEAAVAEGMDAVCDAIYALKEDIRNKVAANRLILLMGMDRICMDFEYVESGGEAKPEKKTPGIAQVRQGFEESGAVAKSQEELAQVAKGQAWVKRKGEYRQELKDQGKSKAEIDPLLAIEKERFFREWDAAHPLPQAAGEPVRKPEPEKVPREPEKEEAPAEGHRPGAYAALGDFTYVVKQGSKLGYHFLLALNSLADLKACGLKKDFFRYRMAFQLSVEDSRELFGSKTASTLPEHICQFDDTLEHYSFRPYLHPGIGWEGWSVNEAGEVQDPFGEGED